MPWTDRQLRALRLLLAVAGGLLLWRYYHNRALLTDPLPPDAPLAARLPPRIDPNTADAPTLAAIPGLNHTLAQRITEFRQSHPPFKNPDDLRAIKGLGPATLDAITPYLAFPTDDP